MKKPEKIYFHSNDINLKAYFYHGIGIGFKPTIIWLHGIPGSIENGKSDIAKNLCKSGINVFRFNYQGIWGNKGKFTLVNSIKDLSGAMDFLTDKENIGRFKIDKNKIVLTGYSYGTAVAMAGALYDKRFKNIICIAVCDYSYFGREYLYEHSKIKEFIKEAINGVFSDKKIFNQKSDLFLNCLKENENKYDIVRHASNLKNKRILLISGIDDNVCPVEDHLLPVYRKLRELKHKNLKMEILKCGHEPPPDMTDIISDWIKEK